MIPPSGKGMTPEEEKARDEQVRAAMAKLASEKYSNLIFNRQEYSLRDGRSLGLSEDSSYLYVNATDQFLKECDSFFADTFKSVKRAGPEEETKVIGVINNEKDRANSGFGMIFGG